MESAPLEVDEPRAPGHPARFYVTTGGALLSRDPLAVARRQVDGVLALCGVGPGRRVLDLHAGLAGRHAVALHERGMEVVCAPFHPGLAAEARSRLAEAGATDVTVVVGGDDGWADGLGGFDLVVDLGTPFGLLDSVPGADRHLAAVAPLVGPDGRFVVTNIGTEVAQRDFRPTDWFEDGDRLVLLSADPVEVWTLMQHRWLLHDAAGLRRVAFTHALLSPTRVARWLRRAGLASVAVHGGLDGRPYDRLADRLVVVAGR